jgi:glycosyltransferase involved in cell wall biosynthesis
MSSQTRAEQGRTVWAESTPRLRILHCIPGFGGGGAERQLTYLVPGLQKNGVDVHIAFHLEGPNLPRIQDSGATLHKLRSLGNHDPLILWQLISTVRAIKPDLIQTWLTQMDILGGVAAYVTQTPFLLMEQASGLGYTGTWKDGLRCLIGQRAAVIVANSNAGKEYWRSRKRPDLIRVIRNAVPMEEIRQTVPSCINTYGIQETSEVLLFAGRYSSQKNVLTLLDAILRVLSDRVTATAVFFGAGPLESELVARARSYAMDGRIRILPYTNELWSWMKRASLFVSPSIFEGSPNAIYEAAALKCPLVLSNIPEHRELLSDDSAFFVDPDSPLDIARGIHEGLQDPERAKRKAESANVRLSHFTIDLITSQYLALYKAVLEGSELMPCLE